jgi:hypothetical protein
VSARDDLNGGVRASNSRRWPRPARVGSIQFLIFGGFLYRSARCVYGVGKAIGASASLVLIATLVAALQAHRFGVIALTLLRA